MKRLLRHRAAALTVALAMAVGSFYGCRTLMGVLSGDLDQAPLLLVGQGLRRGRDVVDVSAHAASKEVSASGTHARS